MVLVPLILRATDQASSTIRSVNSALSGLNRPVGQVNQSFGGLSNVITGSILKANLLAGAFTTALGTVQRGVGFVQNALTQGTQIQLQNIQAISTFSSLTGESYEEATKFIDQFNVAIARSSASLPGSSEEFAYLGRQISDSFIPAFQDASGVLDKTGLQENLLSITESFGALSAAGGIQIEGTTMGVSRALGGASLAELSELELFQNNATLVAALEKGLEQAGADSFEDLEIGERIKVLREAGESLITEDFKREAGQSVEGLMQSFQSNVFGPNGVFGVMRDLDLGTDQVESVFSSYNESVKLLIGEEGLLNTFSSIMADAGLAFDPMLAVKTGLDTVNAFLKDLDMRLDYVSSTLKNGGSLLDTFSNFARNYLADALSFFTTGRGTDDPSTDLKEVVFQGLNNAIASALSFLQSINYTELGFTIGKGVGTVLGVVQGELVVFLSNLDYVGILVGIGKGAIAIIQTIAGAFAGILTGLTKELTPRLQDALKNLGVDIWNAIKTSILALRQTGIDAIGGLFNVGNRSASMGATGDMRFAGRNNPQVEAQRATIRGNAAIERNRDLRRSQAAENRGSLDLSLFQGTGPATRRIGARADGQMPTGFSSLLSAVALESRRAPTGASLVVANSSEAIIPRSAVQPLPATGGGGQRPISISIGNIVSNAADPEAVANFAVQKIQALFEQEYNAQLT